MVPGDVVQVVSCPSYVGGHVGKFGRVVADRPVVVQICRFLPEKSVLVRLPGGPVAEFPVSAVRELSKDEQTVAWIQVT